MTSGTRVDLRADQPATLASTRHPTRALLLQGQPIDEPIAARGPFVMNTPAELDEAYRDYRAGRYGAWPWTTTAPTHGTDPRRFARTTERAPERAVA